MLVLTRKSEERILIGGNIEIVVLGVRGNTVRIGIIAPRAVPVLRGEIVGREPSGDVQYHPAQLPAAFQKTRSITMCDKISVNVLHKFCAQRTAWRIANAARATGTPVTATPTSDAARGCAVHSG